MRRMAVPRLRARLGGAAHRLAGPPVAWARLPVAAACQHAVRRRSSLAPSSGCPEATAALFLTVRTQRPPRHRQRRDHQLVTTTGSSSSSDKGSSPTTLKQSERIVHYALAGNLVIAAAKAAVSAHSGSSAMLSEAVHSVVDAGNQALLLVGLRVAAQSPSKLHPYGYGKAVYVWSLVSALGTFWLGGGVSMYSAISELQAPSLNLDAGWPWEVFGVLGMSFCVDGFVLVTSARHFLATKPRDRTAWAHLRATRDPTVLAVLLEDAAACAGVVVAGVGVAAAHASGVGAVDAAGGLAVGCLLAGVGAALASLNARYLIGSAVEPAVLRDIERLLRERPSVDAVHSVQSTIVGPDAFSYKCEVDFDAAWLSRRLAPEYEPLLLEAALTTRSSSSSSVEHASNSSTSSSSSGSDAASGPPLETTTTKERRRRLRRLLAQYAEDVMTTLEAEVRDVEHHIRLRHPTALFIEIEPAAALKVGAVVDDGAAADEDDEDEEEEDEASRALGPNSAARRWGGSGPDPRDLEGSSI